MNKPKLSKLVKNLQTTVRKYSPEILTGIGIAGMISTTIMAVKATPKALKLIEDAETDGENTAEALSKKEIVKTCWKCYIPAAITGTVSIACLIGASSVNARRNAALATAYTLSETAFSDYRDKVIETIGEKKEQNVRDKVAEEQVKRNPVTSNEVIVTEKGNVLCYDCITGRYFKSDINLLKKAVNEINARLIDEMYMPLNDLYYEIGLPRVDIGDNIGWNIEDGTIDMRYSSQLADDGTPCIVMEYRIAPRWDYKNLH